MYEKGCSVGRDRLRPSCAYLVEAIDKVFEVPVDGGAMNTTSPDIRPREPCHGERKGVE